jgi:hypothetical protein
LPSSCTLAASGFTQEAIVTKTKNAKIVCFR